MPAPLEANSAPPCWNCQHYRRKVREDHAAFHWCELTQPEFPRIGNHCRAYLYEPGADAQEYGA